MRGSAKQHSLVDKLIRDGVLKSPKPITAMRNIDRIYFTPKSELYAYADTPQGIGYSATISAPHMHAYALECLQDYLLPNTSALDIGSGSGYLTLCMAYMMDFKGVVHGIEHIPQLVSQSIANIKQICPEVIDSKIVQMHVADGRHGLAAHGPYRAIHVGAASPIVPRELVDQLDLGGRLLIPVGQTGATQYMTIVDKDMRGMVSAVRALPVSYVPLTSKQEQYPDL